jgi:broad specificity phosphatase PhoE
MIRLLMARHGESEWQVRGAEAGSDSPLTALGRRQAERLGRWLAAKQWVDRIYASPLERARVTAELVAAHVGLPVHFLDDLAEAWFLVASELSVFTSPLSILDGVLLPEQEGGEDYLLFRGRVERALREILSAHPEGTTLIVVHGGTIETIFRLLLGSDFFSVNLGNTTLHSLVWYEQRWCIEFVDHWEHLRGL